MISLPVTRTSFLDSRFRLRGRVNRLLNKGLPVNDAQLDPVAHVGRPGVPLAQMRPHGFRTDETRVDVP